MRFFFFLPFFIVFLGIDLSYAQSGKMDVLHYKFSVDLSDSSDIVIGQADLTIQIPSQLDSIVLDFSDQMHIQRVLIGTTHVAFVHGKGLIRIPILPAYLGQSVAVNIKYTGMPRDGLIISQNKYGQRTFFTDHWPTRASEWLPVVDHPTDKATCEFVVTAPAHYQVVSNGHLVSEKTLASGKKMTHWKMDKVIPTKVMAMGAAEFHVTKLDSMSHVWLYKHHAQHGHRDFGDAPEILRFMEEKIGPYPFEKLDHVESTTVFGGMENASCIFYSERAIAGKKNLNTLIAHEVAHQWFGNSASEAKWGDVWLSEGFATYFELLYLTEKYGLDSLKKNAALDEKKIIEYEQAHPQTAIVQTDSSNLNGYLNTLTYEKGAWVLRLLNQRLGQKVFDQIIRTYYERYAYSNATSEDFIAVAQEISGKDLSYFFNQWLYVPGSPRINYSWKLKRNSLELNFEQLTDHTYQLIIDVPIKTSNNSFEIRKVMLTQKKQQISLDNIRSDLQGHIVLDPLNIICGTFNAVKAK
ncbi:M1 family metallopeptidase [Reichenbachiella agarivorans]|uniref:Aminopeptidase N n=1 Tax=Reichenbachiella agarivorans TaxID=2979464 RepID=A0ABY6CTU3_9BACT|nr:M1 family metallopeptidase [Reichenbachiella agarivorans]UXP33936.1 M1 family metallopeptidase [Reichenbachiella agarivorans]